MPLVYSALCCLLYCMLLCTTGYSITIAMLYVYTEVWRILLIGIMAKEMQLYVSH